MSYRLYRLKRRIKEWFAYFYFKYINPDAQWCGLVMWYVDDAPWDSFGDCTGCDYCGRASHGEIPRSALDNLFFTPTGKHFSDHIFTSLTKEET